MLMRSRFCSVDMTLCMPWFSVGFVFGSATRRDLCSCEATACTSKQRGRLHEEAQWSNTPVQFVIIVMALSTVFVFGEFNCL